MKRIKQNVLIIVVMFCMAFFISNESMATTAIVNTDTLNLRKEASTDSTVLELLNFGEKLEVIEQSGDWVKIRTKGITGYVHKDYVKIEDEEPIMQQEPTTEENPQEQNEGNTNRNRRAKSRGTKSRRTKSRRSKSREPNPTRTTYTASNKSSRK